MKVLIADDSLVFRRVLSSILGSLPGVEVVGEAANGLAALRLIRELRPDVITLDLDMPELDGLGVLDALRAEPDPPAVIVLSAADERSGLLTMQALQRGAFDFIPKPEAENPKQGREKLSAELALRLKAAAFQREVHGLLGSARTRVPTSPAATRAAARPAGKPIRTSTLPPLILIGVSTGGPNALATLLPALPARLGAPVLVVQHMPPLFTKSLAESLNAKCALSVREAADGDVLAADTVYIAPGGKQMRLAVTAAGIPILRITDDPPEHNCKPAVDYLFRSVAQCHPGKAVAAILTGMGSDGTLGAGLLKRQGCRVIAQNEATCVVYGMPRAAVEAGIVDQVLPLGEIAGALMAAMAEARE